MDPRLETLRQLIEDLGQQLLMFQDFAHLHDAHNGCLDEQFAIFLQVALRGLLLLFQLGLHGNVDIDYQLLAENQRKKISISSRPGQFNSSVTFCIQ